MEASSSLKAICFFLIIFSSKAWSAETLATQCIVSPKTLPTTPAQWLTLKEKLDEQTAHCLNNSVYLALYGAAQLNIGQLPQAIESLERALLLDENNGAALIDYSSALYYSGQIFSAIDLNKQLLTRTDLTPNIKNMLEKRAVRWEESTRTQKNYISVQSGYDSNLNSATHIDSLVLNSPGGDVTLLLNDSSKAVSGKYFNIETNHVYTDHSDFREQSYSFGTNFRVSDHSDSNYIQLSGQYQDKHLLDQNFVVWSAQASYVHYNEKPLSLILSGTAKYQWNTSQACQPSVHASLENLTAIQQRTSDSINLYTGLGLSCRIGNHAIDGKAEMITDHARSEERVGGDQAGWRVNLEWKTPVFKGILSNSLRYSQVTDKEGYDPLLANGDNRERQRTEFSMEYAQLLDDSTLVSLLFTKHTQKSNISLFEQRGTRIGLEFKKSF